MGFSTSGDLSLYGFVGVIDTLPKEIEDDLSFLMRFQVLPSSLFQISFDSHLFGKPLDVTTCSDIVFCNGYDPIFLYYKC